MQDIESPFLRLAAIFTETSSSRYREMNSFSAGNLWVISFNNIFSNVFLDLITVIGIIAQSVKYLRKGKMRKVFQNLLGRSPKLPPFNNGAHRRSRTFDNRLASEDFIVTTAIINLKRKGVIKIQAIK